MRGHLKKIRRGFTGTNNIKKNWVIGTNFDIFVVTGTKKKHMQIEEYLPKKMTEKKGEKIKL
jgi:hypothetical protein